MNVLETLSCLHILFQISCLSPCLIDRKTWTLKESKLFEIYIMSIILFSITFMVFSLFTENDFFQTNSHDLGKNMDLIQMVGMRIAHIISMSEALLKRKEEKKIYEEIMEIDRIFEYSLNIDVKNKEFHRTTLVFGFLITFFYLAVEFIILTTSLTFYNERLLYFWIFYLMPLLICSLRYFQMFTSIRLLKHRLDLLLNIFNQIYLNKSESEHFDLKDTIIEEYRQKNYSSLLAASLCKNIPKIVMENTELQKLLLVRDLYNRLFDLSGILNCYFGVSMLINICNDFISITSNCYWIFYNFHDFYMKNDHLWLIGVSVVWSLPHLINVVVLALLCQSTVQKTCKIALNLHSINMDINNDNHNTVIEQFSLQLLHQKIAITAAGFFNIDCTLLYKIVGATTTYLIILIQFHMNDNQLGHSH